MQGQTVKGMLSPNYALAVHLHSHALCTPLQCFRQKLFHDRLSERRCYSFGSRSVHHAHVRVFGAVHNLKRGECGAGLAHALKGSVGVN